jgi:hypothetical protein
MRKVLLPIMFCAAVVSVSSCDFLRSLAGRPTSEQLKSASQTSENPAADSEVTAAAVEEDTLAVETPQGQVQEQPSVQAQSEPEYEMVRRHGRLNVPFAYTHTNSSLKSTPEHTYYILVGTYRQKPTLNKMISDARKAGYEPCLLEYANGLVSVGLLPCDSIEQAIDAYATVKNEKFCPGDACVLIAR